MLYYYLKMTLYSTNILVYIIKISKLIVTVTLHEKRTNMYQYLYLDDSDLFNLVQFLSVVLRDIY